MVSPPNLKGQAMKIKTSDLIDQALDWAVGSCINPNSNPLWPYGRISWSPLWKQYSIPDEKNAALRVPWTPSTNWAQGGPIIEREGITIKAPFDGAIHRKFKDGSPRWGANKGVAATASGPTALIAIMRCFVASKLGDEVDVPEELL